MSSGIPEESSDVEVRLAASWGHGNSPKRKGKKERRILYRGKPLDGRDLQRIRRILRRTKGQDLGEICQAVCRSFGWYRANGAPRETSVRSLLRRLERRGVIELPSESLRRRTQASRARSENPEVRRCAAPRKWPELSLARGPSPRGSDRAGLLSFWPARATAGKMSARP